VSEETGVGFDAARARETVLAMSQTLAYPERVEYRQDNDTFALYRKIYTADGAYAFTTRVVISASGGKVITAVPQTRG
jgi:hypothetical protein